MRLDAGRVLKRAVLCRQCNEEYLFTLRAIAEQSELSCPACGHSIAIRDHAYEPLVSDVRNLLTTMDTVPTHFMSPKHAEYGAGNSG
jgi:DNA-directed RNA polymerase subunit RPC12/RpoP